MLRAALLLLCVSCIGGEDVQAALDGYCSGSRVHECAVESDCCTHFTCVNKICVEVMPGICLLDAGTLGTGATCGCSKDCMSGSCQSNSTCK